MVKKKDFLEKFNDYYSSQCGIVDEIIQKHLHNKIRPKKEKNRIFNKKSMKIFLNNVSEYHKEIFSEEHLITWIIYRFGFDNAKKLIHYRLLLKFRKNNEKE